ncbi:hypothetical protein CcaverHIS002_0702770 [Cutaneotrichosporon cavernicola]|uniref:PSP proline-rich domain-containing protein n=1 Tax=Cutaneotrichosporon cavernicola TaxID=279322 RepID=A0AA48LA33_9TREE|nr:uncharacterized protein CcaverHIS019_0702850 [Cutaneotrichosporon cavernicola]BEI86931.1 hypothetical protein CcaverHIS002_0702770 [Cutaneotrichosporon cavernicola]BEI94704.1 hypothetical protein CcaverHIS019_0702850 [Cutaneotrichosporon cavernicola]BEJ02479.1 hypothetical protein CcaverHIS631_0702740 [Cutaneotrichosporon cavernicola]BEJ10237.1 hypothetical protein CcaverHIS641_0702720 [Cutaneotrichosporon cavernicola]
MSAPAVANGAAPNGHAGGVKSSAAKSRGALKRLKAKQKRAASEAPSESSSAVSDAESNSVPATPTSTLTVEAFLDSAPESDPNYSQFATVFRHFNEGEDGLPVIDAGPKKGEVYWSDEEEDDEEAVARAKDRAMKDAGMTRRERRNASKLSVAELKQLVDRPEVVEWFDRDARDPRLLVTLKSYRNSVPIPSHWNAKRDYLAGRRGMEKTPFNLPQWIADTGIGEQRDAVKSKESAQSLAQKTRERVQPKMGKIDIDYQKLHDAFFKFQGKPAMSKFGEAYYEGKEMTSDLRTKKPGDLSDELIDALSIPPNAPPPWLIAMQRFGPPPSYPNLRIRGLNAPIPAGAQWGFHPGGWGKPPMDEYNRPLYGDVFGVVQGAEIEHQNAVNRERWGEIEHVEAEESDEEEEEEEEEEEAESEDEDEDGEPSGGLETPSGLATPSGYNSVTSTVPGGLETPDFVDLRKRRERPETEDRPSGPRELYTVIPERESSVKGFMGSSTAYDLSAAAPVLGEDRGTKRKSGDVEVSLDGDEDLTPAQLKAKYDAARAETSRVHVPGANVDRSEFDDIVSSETKKRARKEEKRGKEKTEKFKF